MRRQVFVNDTAGRGVEHLDPVRSVAVDHTVLADTQPPQPFEIRLQRLDISESLRQSKDSSFEPTAWFRRQRPLVITHLIRERDFSQQGRTRDTF